MTRRVMRLAMAASVLLTVGVTPSVADTLTCNSSAINPGGTFTIADGSVFSAPFDASSNVVLQFDDNINPILAAELGVNPSMLRGNEQNLYFAFSDTEKHVMLPGLPTTFATPGTPATPIAAVPEPGSLALLGSGLFLFARAVRSRAGKQH